MSRSECLSDLVAHARRHRLTQTEQVRLEQHLSVCASCRREQQLGADFDEVGGFQRGDHRLIGRLGDRAVERLGMRLPPRRSVRSWSIAAALACTLFAAGAGAGVLWRVRTLPPLVPSDSSSTSGIDVTPKQPTAVSTKGPPAQSIDDSVPATTPVPFPFHPKAQRRAPVSPSASTAAAVETPNETASVLFGNANRERRQAHAAVATGLYDELERRFPRSEEARVSHVSLGRLLLERSAWSEAKTQFDEYLTLSPDGILAPEALFGRAQALRALGRRDEERATWTELLTRFADSVYASRGRHRVEGLR
jgi:TolA-binding protein